MLETIREFALEQLGADTTARAAHTQWALELAETGEPELIGRDQARWFERLDTERANLREALDTRGRTKHSGSPARCGGSGTSAARCSKAADTWNERSKRHPPLPPARRPATGTP